MLLKNPFKMTQKYRVVIYARMSSDKQNPRSPDQQIETIKKLIEKLKLPWEIVAIYRDDAISGRYKRKRPGFLRMLRELKSGQVKADLVLVDTFERLSRGEDNAEIRRKIARAGALVLTADSQFQDPTSVSGKALAMVESFRASEESRIKGHNVLRGKKDCVNQGHWPGGPIPFGCQLENVFVPKKGVEVLDHRCLVPIPELKWIVELIFELAAEHGYGGTRIAKRLNSHPDVPDELKPFLDSTISAMLDNEIYYGELVWGKNCTGIIDDVRVLQALPEEEWTRKPDFCEGIVSRELWNRAQQIRIARRRSKVQQNVELSGDTLVPRSKGVALKYPLSGLVVCAHCGRSMVSTSSSAYQTVAGDERRYVSYVCPGYRTNACDNDRRIPEPWLRQAVFELVKQRLFPEDIT